jgi:hypothetical protein
VPSLPPSPPSTPFVYDSRRAAGKIHIAPFPHGGRQKNFHITCSEKRVKAQKLSKTP